jgi:excisionase family DNA binding protein
MDADKIPKEIKAYIDLAVRSAISAFTEKISMQNGSDDFISAEQAARLLKIKLSTLYSKVEAGELPYSRSGKRKLLFSKDELIVYISKRRSKSNCEITEEAEQYVLNNKK